MTTRAQIEYQRCELRLIVARARLLLQISGPDRNARLADLLTFAHAIEDSTQADSLAAFRAAQSEQLQAAQAELARLSATASNSP